MATPAKSDIEAIFHRLRASPANKTCFDCNAKNPTWATVTYGVFICIDCSAVHRSLGVHLTFVRSTNLDTNWTWPQIRQMQLGGNANAGQFFRQHNCNTTDAQQKYNSRAAQLYRDKLALAAQQAMKTFGTAVFIDGCSNVADEKKTEEEDFFAECANDNHGDGFSNAAQQQSISMTNNNCSNNTTTGSNGTSVGEAPKIDLNVEKGAPSVDFLNYSEPVEVKSSIGVRKIQSRRGLNSAKKGGLGATKVKTNFADLEQRAHLADQQKFAVTESKPQTREEELETLASVRLAYQDLSLKAQKEEEKLKPIDPAKAKQMERLGMGFNVRSGVSHSALTDMTTIDQTPTPSKYKNSSSKSSSSNKNDARDDFYDEYLSNSSGSSRIYTSKIDHELDKMGFELIEPVNNKVSSMFSPLEEKKSPPGYSSINDRQPSTGGSSSGSKIKQQQTTPGGTVYNTYETDDAQKKFGAAKAISSDQFFNKEATSFERSANMAKFQGSNSISSAEYFGDGPSTGSRGGSRNNYSGPDLDDVRESVRHGVTKVAGRLSSLATDMMSSLQDKYGG